MAGAQDRLPGRRLVGWLVEVGPGAAVGPAAGWLDGVDGLDMPLVPPQVHPGVVGTQTSI